MSPFCDWCGRRVNAIDGPRQDHMASCVWASSAVVEAERIAAEAASASEIDRMRAEFDAAVERHCLMFGFDTAVES